MTAVFPWQHLSSPADFARHSPRIQNASNYITRCISQLNDVNLQKIINSVFAQLHAENHGWLLLQNKTTQKNAPQLCAQLSKTLDYNAWWGAPAAAEKSHHPYPGGWLMHNATNLHALNALIRTAQEIRDISLPTDAILAGMLLHDCLKPHLFLWENSELADDQGECGHHIAAIAESYLRGVPLETLHMLAGIHAGWWENTEAVAGFMERAAELIDKPELSSKIELQMDLLPETWIMRRGEQAWYWGTRGAFQNTKETLRDLIKSTFPEAEWTRAEWWILSQCDELQLASHLARGKSTFEREIARITHATPR